MFFLILSILASLEEDGDLVRRLKERDSEAMNELYVRFGRLALAVIQRIVRDHGTAEDLLQETFLRVWNRVASFDQERGAFGPWILTIARNRAIDHLRSLESRHVDTGVDMARLERTSFFVDVEREYSDQDSIRRIRSAFTKLTENQRMVLELAYFEGLSQTEMADRLNQPLGTVKTWVRTALQILRQELTNAALGA